MFDQADALGSKAHTPEELRAAVERTLTPCLEPARAGDGAAAAPRVALGQ